jgi:biotin carboxyl carrier protein
MIKKLRVTLDGKAYEVTVECLEPSDLSPGQQGADSAVAPSGDSTQTHLPLPSPLAGKVVSLSVEPGTMVQEGDELLILEAMKMNTHFRAPQAGTVGEVLVRPGDQVEEGQTLLMLKS